MPTPPSNPNYGLVFSDCTIRSIVQKVFPEVRRDDIDIERLPSGRSFNNRIYFVTVRSPDGSFCGLAQQLRSLQRDSGKASLAESTASETAQLHRFVLKIAGYPFGAPKIQNEVASLLLLQKYCPSVPVPRVVAWSDLPNRVRTVAEPMGFDVQFDCEHAESGNACEADTHGRPWILMSRLDGSTIVAGDLTGLQGDQLMSDLSRMAAEWRTKLPRATAIGNLILREKGAALPSASSTLYNTSLLPGIDVCIDGLLITADPSTPLHTPLAYHTHRLSAATARLASEDIYRLNHPTVTTRVTDFAQHTLPRIPLVSRGTDAPVFTHYDLSPRNVLVAVAEPALSSPANVPLLRITGIIDLEFSGFFPSEEEFANTLVNNADDWPATGYRTFLRDLQQRDALPPCLLTKASTSGGATSVADEVRFGSGEFQQACALMRVVENIAPWWVKVESALSETQLREELEAAKDRVEKGIGELERAAGE